MQLLNDIHQRIHYVLLLTFCSSAKAYDNEMRGAALHMHTRFVTQETSKGKKS